MNKFTMTPHTIDENTLRQSLENAQAGALVTFSGWVRNHNEGKDVDRLEYQAYEVLANKEGNKILQEALEKFDVLGAQAQHRVGCLEIGESAVFVGVISKHRREAFEACQYIIDNIKDRVPIWKLEHYTDGQREWVNCHRCAHGNHYHHH